MSLTLQSPCLVRTALILRTSASPSHASNRTLFEKFFGRRERPTFIDPTNPDFLKRKPAATPTQPTQPTRGDLDSSSIFDDPSIKPPSSESPTTPAPVPKLMRDPTAMAVALDPTPHARQRWQRKMLIRDIRSRYRLSKTRQILRTERTSLCKSPMIKTSVKKLGPLARQIAGKPIEDAIVQMRFSKKKAALEVKRHLEYARDAAIVGRGMGLGDVKEDAKEIVFKDRDGVKRRTRDITRMYVDQAWVGRGRYGKEPEFRAMGRVNMLRPPRTSISVLLKEEKTRIRLAKEREEKRLRKKVWVQLPDRPITVQRQYCLW